MDRVTKTRNISLSIAFGNARGDPAVRCVDGTRAMNASDFEIRVGAAVHRANPRAGRRSLCCWILASQSRIQTKLRKSLRCACLGAGENHKSVDRNLAGGIDDALVNTVNARIDRGVASVQAKTASLIRPGHRSNRPKTRRSNNNLHDGLSEPATTLHPFSLPNAASSSGNDFCRAISKVQIGVDCGRRPGEQNRGSIIPAYRFTHAGYGKAIQPCPSATSCAHCAPSPRGNC